MKRLALYLLLIAPFAYGQNSTTYGSITLQSSTCSGAGAGYVEYQLPINSANVAITLSGTWSGTVQFVASIDGSTWNSIGFTPLASGSAVTSATANGSWTTQSSGNQFLCVYASSFSSGPIQVALGASTGVPIALPPPFAVDITQPPYNAKCDGHTDDHVAIQAALDQNPAIYIPVNSSSPTECMLGTVGITLCSAANKFGYNAIYGNGQILGYTGAASAITVSGTCAGGSQETSDRIEDLYIDSSSATGTPTMIHVDNPTVHVVINNFDDENYPQSNPYISLDLDGSEGGNEGLEISNYLGSGTLKVEGGADGTCCSIVSNSQFGSLELDHTTALNITATDFGNGSASSTIYDSIISLEGSVFAGALTFGTTDGAGSSVTANSVLFGGSITATGGGYLSTFNGGSDQFVSATLPVVTGPYTGVIRGIGPSLGAVNEENGLELPPFSYSAAGTPLPSCTSDLNAPLLQVSDATIPTFLGTYTSGGAVKAPVLCNGTNWVTY